MNPGDSIGPYVIDSALGAGGMGRVYRARDTRLGRDVALKQLSDPSLATDVARRRVLQEARAAAGLSHPNIATIFDVLDTAEGPAIVMEFVPGESLSRQIARGPLPAARALEIAIQVADGLTDAHNRRIIHRDLKPANIQIRPDGRAKILDFGIARFDRSPEDRATATTVTSQPEISPLAGTPAYMAPEQLGGARADERSDIYALGVLLYEMLTGRRPFPATDLLGAALEVMRGTAPPIAELAPATPPHVSALVARAMARDPSDRFQTAGELAGELRRTREQLDSPVPSHVVSRTRPRKASAGLALAAVAGVLLAAGWYWAKRPSATVASAHGSVFAVLPFRNLTSDRINEEIAFGLTDAVATRLSSLESIRVLSLEATREVARGATNEAGILNPVAVAKSLGARYVVEGGIRRAGQTIDVDVALVDADGKRQPAGRYTGDIARTLDLHHEIAQGVIGALAKARALSTVVSLSPPPTLNQEAFAEYAQARMFLERADDPTQVDYAIGLFQGAINKDSRFALAHAGLGQAYWAKYRLTQDPAWTSKAIAAILDALRIDENKPEVRLSLAVMYQGLGRLDGAEEELRRVIREQPHNDDAHRLMAGVHIDRGHWDAAVSELGRAIQLRPTYWRNYSELGYAHYRAGRWDDAEKAYARVVELQPDSALGHHMLGTVHQSAGRNDKALTNYMRATRFRPRYTTYSNIGTIHFWNGEYLKAATAYQQAINLSPNTPGLYANLGDAQQKLGQPDAARASYRKAVEEMRRQLGVNENDAGNLSLLALYLAKLGDRTAADASSKKALALNPKDGEVLYGSAMVDALAGRRDDACRRLGEAVKAGASTELVRRADEFRTLKGCVAYDRIVTR